MRSQRKAVRELLDNPILVGTITILVVVIAVYLSYIAENGLPFIPTYSVNVDVQNAAELVKNADVRVGGTRVGQVLKVTPGPATRAYPHPFARLRLALQKSLEPLPPDTRYQVRLASVLGGKYVELLPGTIPTGGLPDGGTFYLNANPRLDHNIPFVDLDTAFSAFGPKTQQAFRSAVGAIGDALAGRGAQLNDATYSLRRLIGPLDELLALFASPSTHLSQFISGAAATTGALAAVAPSFSSLLSDGASTLAALQNAAPALGQSIDQLPGTESTATEVLTNARPVLTDAASITRDLEPAAALLPLSSQRFDQILLGATPVFRRAPQLSSTLQTALAAVDALARDPATTDTFSVLSRNDLATFGGSAVAGLGAILRAVAPAQFACNIAALWARNLSSDVSEGDSTAPWMRFVPVLAVTQAFLSSKPSPDLHVNPYPIENTTQCQAGNEGYSASQLIGNPAQTSRVVDNTVPPAGVSQRAARAGLLGGTP